MATAPPPITPEKAPLTPARVAWMALAILDTIVLAYVAASVPWGLETPSGGSSPYGEVIKIVAVVVTIAAKAFTAGLMLAVGYAIVQDLRGPWKPSRTAAALLFLPFLAAMALLAVLAGRELFDALDEKVMRFGDRLVVFDRLSVAHAPGQSIGAYLAVLALAGYLVEKYMFRWFNLRHFVCIIAIGFTIGWPVREAWERERDQREWLKRQEWKALSEHMTFVDALGACKALGPGWRLPLRLEAAIYFASLPEAIRAWKGVAWTAMQAEMGRTGVVVELAPRRTGTWRSNYVPWRDRSLCEKDAYASARSPPNDWFTALLPHFCEAPADHEGMHVSTVQLIAELRGQVVGGVEPQLIVKPTEAATVCLKPTQDEIPEIRHRRYPKERGFRDAESFLAYMKESCNPRVPGSDAAACALFGGEAPAPIAK